jgi:hypothetical protein
MRSAGNFPRPATYEWPGENGPYVFGNHCDLVQALVSGGDGDASGIASDAVGGAAALPSNKTRHDGAWGH